MLIDILNTKFGADCKLRLIATAKVFLQTNNYSDIKSLNIMCSTCSLAIYG